MTLPPAAPGAQGAPLRRVLFVCTGNVCRSPAAERLTAARLGRAGAAGDGVLVRSAGTGALVGAPIAPPMARLLADHGADPTGFRARALTHEMVEEADLVLALSREHRSVVVGLDPSALARTFTLRQLARFAALGAGATPTPHSGGSTPSVGERLMALRDAARSGRRAPARPEDDDVADPYGQRSAAYRRSMQEIEAAVDAIASAVGA
ncbi:low molecular weight phosphatase family protein [Luteimicrobium subarcticum]|uniref:Protein-tyrosine phosphatase n=1 Tax=Luteimicrobium subarcticum TaxID=620910 RepID=A0A2M8WUZ1_9MICO|nr:low molecular weight phosphatase family protein [Luteimicrobium subarcticum]PJI94729.1 protein-tyrosine phosphatase [Luteimicrobium subarcticum]